MPQSVELRPRTKPHLKDVVVVASVPTHPHIGAKLLGRLDNLQLRVARWVGRHARVDFDTQRMAYAFFNEFCSGHRSIGVHPIGGTDLIISTPV